MLNLLMCTVSRLPPSFIIIASTNTLVLYAHCIFWVPYELELGTVVTSPNKISYNDECNYMLMILAELFILFKNTEDHFLLHIKNSASNFGLEAKCSYNEMFY